MEDIFSLMLLTWARGSAPRKPLRKLSAAADWRPTSPVMKAATTAAAAGAAAAENFTMLLHLESREFKSINSYIGYAGSDEDS